MGNKTLSYKINIKLYTNYTQLVWTRCWDTLWGQLKKSRLIGTAVIISYRITGKNKEDTMYLRFEVYNCTKSMRIKT